MSIVSHIYSIKDEIRRKTTRNHKKKMREDVHTPPGILFFFIKYSIFYIQPSRRAGNGSQENIAIEDRRTFSRIKQPDGGLN